MANQVATGQMIPEGVNRSNRFIAKYVVPGAIANNETFTCTVPPGCPKDALPVGNPIAFSLAGDVYTRDADVGVVTTHDRSSGVTVFTAAGNMAAGTIVLQEYIGVG